MRGFEAGASQRKDARRGEKTRDDSKEPKSAIPKPDVKSAAKASNDSRKVCPAEPSRRAFPLLCLHIAKTSDALTTSYLPARPTHSKHCRFGAVD